MDIIWWMDFCIRLGSCVFHMGLLANFWFEKLLLGDCQDILVRRKHLNYWKSIFTRRVCWRMSTEHCRGAMYVREPKGRKKLGVNIRHCLYPHSHGLILLWILSWAFHGLRGAKTLLWWSWIASTRWLILYPVTRQMMHFIMLTFYAGSCQVTWSSPQHCVWQRH